ncbi:calcium uptake protein 1: mitochondrial-like isoform X2 [Dinothrombium tinctorium]|uniref:Calcium uptake protein 1: mitochondrial-like isoform X2 n=1 Tax=Dinothrombium tinctorium TaxID=1965070 RepID=A0A443R8Z1_9ACAR|nr:calcium uptake protein 1: mitochondrial-like isoform X2 [Dinothrombium tinctorium]
MQPFLPAVNAVSQRRRFHKKEYPFSHQKVPTVKSAELLYGLLVLIILGVFYDPKKIWKKVKKIRKKWFGVDAAAVTISEQHAEKDEDETKLKKETKHKKGGFRDKKIIEYENRIRSFSTPDKIFRYFATVKVIYDDQDSEIFMTPDDFLRAVTPGLKQPDGYGLDQFKRVDLAKIAFRMFDLNGDGNVDYEEFEKVQNVILHQTSIGQKLGSAVKSNYRGVSSALAHYFFGPDLKQKLTIEKFLEFQHEIQLEMLTLEFERKRRKDEEKIKESDFSELLIAYAGFPEKKKKRMLNRVRSVFPDTTVLESPERGISLKDYLDFHHFLQNINDVDIALTFFNIAGASIDEATLKHAAKTVANVDLRDHVIKVVFTLFDENRE